MKSTTTPRVRWDERRSCLAGWSMRECLCGIALLLGIVGGGRSQTYRVTYGGVHPQTTSGDWPLIGKDSVNKSDIASTVVADPNGNVYVAGYSTTSTSWDYTTVKYNPEGTQLWMARYNGPGNLQDGINAVTLDRKGNVYVTGFSMGADYGADWATIKYDSLGTERWVVRFNGPAGGWNGATGIAVDDSGFVYVIGEVTGKTSFRDFAAVKYDAEGTQVWVVYYNGPANGWDFPVAIALDDSGNVVVTGFSEGQGTGRDFATIKYDASGIEQWVARFDNPNHTDDSPYALAIDRLGNVIVAGTSGVPDALHPRMDISTLSYSSLGQQRWVSYYHLLQDDHEDRANGVAVDSNLNVYVAGYSWGNGTDADIVAVKYDSAGAQQWAVRYDGQGHGLDVGSAIKVDNAGSIYVAGYTTGMQSVDYALIKYSDEGSQQWVATYNGPGNSTDRAFAVALVNPGRVVIGGASVGLGAGFDFATISYMSTGNRQWTARYDGPWGTPVSVDSKGTVTPDAIVLDQNYPNPFNPFTIIRFGLPLRAYVMLTVFNTLGQSVAVLQDGAREAGYHEVKFDCRNLSSGVYYYRIQIRLLGSAVGPASPAGRRDSKSDGGDFVQTRKLLLIR